MPFVTISPDSGRRIRAMHFSNVLFPDPFSPMSANVVPLGTSNEMSWSAQNSSYFTRCRRMNDALSDWFRS